MESGKKRATYQDVLDAPENMIAEILDGELFLSPRPGKRHTVVASALHQELGALFGRGRGGPGGWLILWEPELHFGEQIIVPDIAGWRRERLPDFDSEDDDAYFTLVPDWICEVLSKSTQKRDRTTKLRIYAEAGVSHAWIVHPIKRTIEAMRLHDGIWQPIETYRADEKASIEPFDVMELDLSVLWALLPPRASEAGAEYEPAFW